MEIAFKGKEAVYNYHLTVPYRPIVADPDKSVGECGLEGNLIIHGDNLHALKALMPRYAGKIDCIFIDPPYNTGNESWSYNDAVNSPPAKDWLRRVVDREDLLRHDKWCCMMWPRLRLLHELLAEDGTFWMTLDDNEVAHARMMLDEIFGESNFLADVVWQKKYSTANDAVDFSDMHDNVLAYAKNRPETTDGKVGAVLSRLARSSDQDRAYKNPDNDPRGDWKPGDYTCNKSAEERPHLYYPLIQPKTGKEIWPDKTRVWAYSPERHAKNVVEKRVWWGITSDNPRPDYKRFLSEVKGRVVGTWWDHKFAGHTDDAKKLLQEIFTERDRTFPTPKPLRLIERILELATDEDSTVLDSFAGSGTTAHAVLAANAKDGGERQFILVEGESYAEDVTAERVRRVITGYSFEGNQRETLFERGITWTDLKRAEKIVEEAEALQSARQCDFDKVRAEVKEGRLRVIGERTITDQMPGLGGNFAFCTLGDPLDLDEMLIGSGLPSWAEVAAWLFHTATGATIPPGNLAQGNGIDEWYVAESPTHHVWTIYRPSVEFLRSPDAALSLSLAQQMTERHKGKMHLVFAPFRFVSTPQLRPLGVEYAMLPFSLNRLERE